jgi:hypothetical protein
MRYCELSAFIEDGDYPAIIEALTGVDVRLPLDMILAPLMLEFEEVNPIMTAIGDRNDQAVAAAFAAGIACGLDPKLLLFAGTKSLMEDDHAK